MLSESQALSFVLDRVAPDGIQSERRPLEEQWFGNMAYLYDRPHFVPEQGIIRPPKDPKYVRTKYHANLILPKVMRAIAKLEGVHATLEPLPLSDERDDLRAAKLAGKVFGYLQEQTKFRRKHFRVLSWAAVCGSGFYRVTWNPAAGKKSRTYFQKGTRRPDMRAMFDPTLKAQLDKSGSFQDIPSGDIDLTVAEPFQTWWDPNARGGGVDDCTWMATAIARSPAAIKAQWGVDVSPSTDDMMGTEIYRDVLAFIAGDNYRGIGIPGKERNNLCREIDFYSAPSDENDWQGQHIVVAGGKVLHNDVNPYGWLPFVKIDWFPVEGRFIGLSLVDQLRGPQRARNRAREHVMRFMETSAYAPLILPKNSGIKPVQVAAVHGLILEMDMMGSAPVFGQPAQLPPFVMQNATEAENEMNNIAAQADPTNSKLPGQLRSGVAVQAVQADNNSILTPTSEGMLEGVADLGSKMLELVGTHYEEARVMQIVGPNGDIDVKRVLGSDLRNHYRLRVQAQPGMLDSTESRQARIFEAAQLGILNLADPYEKVLALKGLHFHTADDFANSLLQQETGEWREIDKMLADAAYQSQPMPWMNAYIRSKVLEKFLNSPEFEKLAPLYQKKVATRWQAFAQIIQQQMQAQAALAQQTQGTPGAKGQPSAPRQPQQ